MDTKVCRNCGVEKSIDCFRPYYGGRKGRYTQCKECEAIESRRKYLAGKDELNDAEAKELSNINELYELRRARGLKPPRAIQPHNSMAHRVAALLEQEKEDR